MIINKKVDEKDLELINQSWTAEEKKSFSEFLKERKKKQLSRKERKNSLSEKGFPEEG